MVLDPKMLNDFRTRFETERSRMLAQITKSSEVVGVASEDRMDDLDFSVAEVEAQMELRLRTREALYLRKVNQALARIQEGPFGLCDDCGDAISFKRLESRPTATLCVDCKETEERRELGHIDGHRSKSLGKGLRVAN